MAKKKSAGTFPAGAEDWIEFRESGIHGMGGFAGRRIPKGTRLIEYVGEKITKTEAEARVSAGNAFIFTLDDEFDVDGSVSWNPARFLNHSCEPNAETTIRQGRIWVRAIRDIAPNEEITYNYCYDLVEHEDNPCRCGAARCVGYILAEEFFPQVRERLIPV